MVVLVATGVGQGQGGSLAHARLGQDDNHKYGGHQYRSKKGNISNQGNISDIFNGFSLCILS